VAHQLNGAPLKLNAWRDSLDLEQVVGFGCDFRATSIGFQEHGMALMAGGSQAGRTSSAVLARLRSQIEMKTIFAMGSTESQAFLDNVTFPSLRAVW
jgi:hypothetical protein